MKLNALCCLCGAMFSTTVFADSPRLSLWITHAIGGQADVSACRLPDADAPVPAPAGLSLTERDVLAWEPNTGRWQLDAHRFPNAAAGWRLADHCFELLIDGRRISSGVVLWKHSARLTRIPTLKVSWDQQALQLQLTAGSANPGELIHRAALARVLTRK